VAPDGNIIFSSPLHGRLYHSS